MKPIKLEIEGINSFRERQVIDFNALAEANLFCISGKTGSGKTTILDCIILGLYEKLPAFSSRGNIDDYINLASEKGEIKLTFELDGVLYRTERVISKKTGYNSVRLIDVNSEVAIYEKTTDTFKFLEEKIGLDVEQFAQVIILQQGAFAKFLRAKKADRNNMVINLFRLGRFEKIASGFKAQADELNAEINNKKLLLNEYANDTQEAIRELKREVKELNERTNAVTERYNKEIKLLSEMEENKKIEQAYADAQAKKAEIDKESELLARREEKLISFENERNERRKNEQVRADEREKIILEIGALNSEKDAFEEIEKREKKLKEKREQYLEAEASLKKRDVEIKSAENELNVILGKKGAYANMRTDEIAALATKRQAEFREKVKNEKNIAELKDELKRNQTLQETQEKECEESASAEKKCDDDLAALRRTEQEEMRKSGAAALRKGIGKGDVCPVCGQQIKEELPHCDEQFPDRKPEIAALEEESEHARSQTTLKREELSRLTAEIDSIKRSITEKELELAKIGDVTKQSVDEIEAVLAAAKLYDEKQDELKSKKSEYEKNKELLESMLKQGQEDRRDLDERIGKLSGNSRADVEKKLAQAASKKSELDKEEKEYKALCSWCERERKEVEKEKIAVARKKSAVETVLEKQPKKYDVALDFQKETVKALDKEKTECASQTAVKENNISKMQERLENKRKLEEEKKAITESYEKVYELAKMFDRGKFVSYVATEYIKDFTRTASDTLNSLTGGKYTLSYDEDNGEYYVTDFLNGNSKRKSTTLSGGETFLASLSMAIALSREISKYGNFDFFFIDEGFGTLHDGALDQVTEVLCSLATTSLVGIVTHRTELIGKIPVTLLVSEADETSGSQCRIAR